MTSELRGSERYRWTDRVRLVPAGAQPICMLGGQRSAINQQSQSDAVSTHAVPAGQQACLQGEALEGAPPCLLPCAPPPAGGPQGKTPWPGAPHC